MMTINILSNVMIGGIFVLGAVAATAKQEQHSAEIGCMAQNIYFEARSESIEGQRAVAHVTMNRVAHSNWPNTVCEVVFEPFQFSWTHLVKNHTPGNKELYSEVYKVAEAVYNNTLEDNTGSATFYYADYIDKPHWAYQMDETVRYGVHIFYKWDGTWD